MIRKFSVQGTAETAEQKSEPPSVTKITRAWKNSTDTKNHSVWSEIASGTWLQDKMYFTTGCTWFWEGECSYHGYSGTSELRFECFLLKMRHRWRKRSRTTVFVSII